MHHLFVALIILLNIIRQSIGQNLGKVLVLNTLFDF